MGSMGEEHNIEPAGTGQGSASGPDPDASGASTPPSGPAASSSERGGAPIAAEDTKAGSPKAMTPGQRLAAKRGKKAQQKQEFKADLKRREDEQRDEEEEEAQRIFGGPRPYTGPDPVQEAAQDFTGYMQGHRAAIVIAVVLVLAVGFGVVLGRSYVATGSAEQAALLATAIEIQNAQVDATNDSGKDADDKPVFKSEADRARKAAEAFAAAAKNEPRSLAAGWAKLGEGSALMRLGKAGEAAPLFAATFQAQNEHPALAALALEGQALALEAKGDAAQAVKQLEELKSFAQGSYKDVAEYHIARIKLAQGEREAATNLLKGLYDRLSQTAEGAPKNRYLKSEVELRLGEIDSSLVPAGGSEAQQFSPEEIQRLIQQLQQQQKNKPAGAGQE